MELANDKCQVHVVRFRIIHQKLQRFLFLQRHRFVRLLVDEVAGFVQLVGAAGGVRKAVDVELQQCVGDYARAANVVGVNVLEEFYELVGVLQKDLYEFGWIGYMLICRC